MKDIKVEVFYGKCDLEDKYSGVTFYFDSYSQALDFVKFVELNSNCNALIIQSFDFKDDENTEYRH